MPLPYKNILDFHQDPKCITKIMFYNKDYQIFSSPCLVWGLFRQGKKNNAKGCLMENRPIPCEYTKTKSFCLDAMQILRSKT